MITGIICVVLVCICLSIYAFGKSEMLGSFAGGGLTLRQIVIATGSDAMETADRIRHRRIQAWKNESRKQL